MSTIKPHSKRGQGLPQQAALQDLAELAEVGVRTVIAEPERKRQKWSGQRAAQAAVYANRRRLNTHTAKMLMRRRGELIEKELRSPVRHRRHETSASARQEQHR